MQAFPDSPTRTIRTQLDDDVALILMIYQEEYDRHPEYLRIAALAPELQIRVMDVARHAQALAANHVAFNTADAISAWWAAGLECTPICWWQRTTLAG